MSFPFSGPQFPHLSNKETELGASCLVQVKKAWSLAPDGRGLQSSVAVSCGGLRQVTSLRLTFLPMGIVVRKVMTTIVMMIMLIRIT